MTGIKTISSTEKFFGNLMDKKNPLERDTDPGELSESEKKQVEELKKIDRKVKAHERAHKVAAGDLARGGPTYQYTTGPDNRRYAVGGEVDIDISPVPGDPEATIKKMQRVKRAALAPSDPSGQDRAVAAKAASIEARARAEMAQEKLNGNEEGNFITNKYSDFQNNSSYQLMA